MVIGPYSPPTQARAVSRTQFKRELLPSTEDYLGSISFDLVGGGVQRRAKCPISLHSSKKPFCVNVKTGTWWCHACGLGGGNSLDLHQQVTGQTFLEAARDLNALVDGGNNHAVGRPSRPALLRTVAAPDPAQEQEQARKAEVARDIWRSSIQVAGTPAESYLRERGCRLPPVDGDLRTVPNLALFGFSGPCLVGRISKAGKASQAMGLHLTWIQRIGGRWRRLERRYLGQKAGGVVRLWPDEAVTTGLAVAEGIESALAAAHGFTPVWACMDAGNLAKFPVLEGIESLTIFADRDESGTGQRAAAACADQWLDAGREVRTIASETVGLDIADEVAA